MSPFITSGLYLKQKPLLRIAKWSLKAEVQTTYTQRLKVRKKNTQNTLIYISAPCTGCSHREWQPHPREDGVLHLILDSRQSSHLILNTFVFKMDRKDKSESTMWLPLFRLTWSLHGWDELLDKLHELLVGSSTWVWSRPSQTVQS